MTLSRLLSISAAVLLTPTASVSAIPATPPASTGALGTVAVILNVPVQLSALDPRFTQLKVGCSTVQDGSTAKINADTTVALTNGGFAGTVTVRMLLNVTDPTKAWLYTCTFMLFDSSTNSWWADVPTGAPMGSYGGRLAVLARPGTQSTLTTRPVVFKVQ